MQNLYNEKCVKSLQILFDTVSDETCFFIQFNKIRLKFKIEDIC